MCHILHQGDLRIALCCESNTAKNTTFLFLSDNGGSPKRTKIAKRQLNPKSINASLTVRECRARCDLDSEDRWASRRVSPLARPVQTNPTISLFISFLRVKCTTRFKKLFVNCDIHMTRWIRCCCEYRDSQVNKNVSVKTWLKCWVWTIKLKSCCEVWCYKSII